VPPDLAFARVPDFTITRQEGFNSRHTVQLIEGAVGLQHGLKSSNTTSPDDVLSHSENVEGAVPLQCRCEETTTVCRNAVVRQDKRSESDIPFQGRCKVTTTLGPDVVVAQVE
jgi:hypothetical protein